MEWTSPDLGARQRVGRRRRGNKWQAPGRQGEGTKKGREVQGPDQTSEGEAKEGDKDRKEEASEGGGREGEGALGGGLGERRVFFFYFILPLPFPLRLLCAH